MESAMSRDRLVRQLEDAANNIANAPRDDLQILLRRAALTLRNLGTGLELMREKDQRIIDKEKTQRFVDEMEPDPDGPGAA